MREKVCIEEAAAMAGKTDKTPAKKTASKAEQYGGISRQRFIELVGKRGK